MKTKYNIAFSKPVDLARVEAAERGKTAVFDVKVESTPPSEELKRSIPSLSELTWKWQSLDFELGLDQEFGVEFEFGLEFVFRITEN